MLLYKNKLLFAILMSAIFYSYKLGVEPDWSKPVGRNSEKTAKDTKYYPISSSIFE